jgi:hypothetical protein
VEPRGRTGGVAIGASPPYPIGASSPYKRQDVLPRYWSFPFRVERRGLASRKCARSETISLGATERQLDALVARVDFAARIDSTPWHARAHWNWNLPAGLRPCGAQMRTHFFSADASTDRRVLQDLATRFRASIGSMPWTEFRVCLHAKARLSPHCQIQRQLSR